MKTVPGVALSGGVDSALLLFLAVELGRAPHAFTVATPDDPELLMALRTAREAGVPHTVVEVRDPPDHFVEAVRAAQALIFNGRGVLGVPLYRAMAAAGITEAVSGLGADEVFFGKPPGAVISADDADGTLARSLFAIAPSTLALPSDLPPRALEVELGLQLAWPIEVPIAAAAGVDLRLPFLDDRVLAAASLHALEPGKAPLRRMARARGGWLAELADRPKTPRYAAVGHPRWGQLYADLLGDAPLLRLGMVPARVRALQAAWRDAGPDRVTIDRVLMKLASLVVLAS